MKKFNVLVTVFLLSAVVLISGCGKPVDLSREDTYSVWLDNLTGWDSEIQAMITDQSLQSLDFNINTDNELVYANVDGSFDFEVDSKNANTQAYSVIKGDINEKQEGNNIKFNIDISSLNFSGIDAYMKINMANINLGDNNVSTSFVDNIVKNLAGQWIQLDSLNELREERPDTDESSARENYEEDKGIAEFVEEYPFVKGGEKTKYNKKIAYEVELDDEIFMKLLKDMYGEGSPFIKEFAEMDTENLEVEAYLVIQDGNTVDFVIDKIYFEEDPDTYASIIVSKDKMIINIISEKEESKFEIILKKIGDDVEIEISGNEAGESIFDMIVKLRSEDRDGLFVLSFDGIININNIEDLIVDSKERSIRVDFDGEYTWQSTSGLEFNKPEEYLLLSHILSDQFGMGDIIEDEVFDASTSSAQQATGEEFNLVMDEE